MSQLVTITQFRLVPLKIERNTLAEALNFPIFAARFIRRSFSGGGFVSWFFFTHFTFAKTTANTVLLSSVG